MSTCASCGGTGAPGALFCGTCGSRLAPKPIASSGDQLIGQTLNHTYFIQQKLGSGGMGDVYKAIHQKLDAPVALKIVRRELLGHPAIVHRFEREARAASRLRHPNVVAVTDFGQMEDGTVFMVMEYVAGKSLASVIASDAPMTERRVVRIGTQILSALAEAHANDILHRDLKPENVMIEARRDAPDFVKVLDFGIAKLLGQGVGSSTLTQAGLVCGTPGYMSPEQLRGGEVDARSDLFSVGIVLYEMLTHKLPFDVATPMEMLHRHLSEVILPPSERGALPVSPLLDELVIQALSAEPENRPPTAVAMRTRLLAVLSSDAGHDRESDESLTTEILRPSNSPRPVQRSAAPATPSPRDGSRTVSSGRPPSPSSSRTAAPPPRTPTPGPQPSVPSRTPAPPRPRATAGRKTLPLDRTRSAIGVTPATAARRGATGGAAGPFDAVLLKRIEDHVATMLGPVAPHLVRKVSREAATIDDLCQQLAVYVRSPDDRKQFLAWAGAELGVSAARSRTATIRGPLTTAAWDPAVLDTLTRELAVHVGPVARILVRRVSGQAQDAEELYDLLAREIPSEREREVFRRQFRASMPRDDGPE